MTRQRKIRFWTALATVSSILLATHSGVSSAAWTQTNGPKGGSIRSLLAVPNGLGGTSLFAGQLYVWRTDQNGASWSHLKSGLTDPTPFALLAVPNGSGGNDILAGTYGGVFRSADNGATWSPMNIGLTSPTVYSLASGSNGSGGTYLYAGTYGGRVFRSSDGATWTNVSSGLPTSHFNVNGLVTTSTGAVLAGTDFGIYRSTDFGASWTRVWSTGYGFSFAKNGTTIYAGTSGGVHRSTNDGATWTPINNGIQFSWIRAMAAIPNESGVTLFAGAGGVLRSVDNGATWTSASNGLTNFFVFALTTAPNASGGTDLYAGTGEGVFRSTDNGASWTNVSFVYSVVRDMAVLPSGAILASTENDIFRSTDGGATWIDANANTIALDFALQPTGGGGTTVYSADALTGVFKSTDGGVTWNDTNNDIVDIEVNSVTVVPNGTGGTNVIAGTYSGIVVSSTGGANWVSVAPSAMPLDFVVIPNGAGGHTVFGGGFGGVVKSTNYGSSWTVAGVGETMLCMAATADGSTMLAGGEVSGVYRSTDQGATWSLANDGLTDIRISALLSPDGSNFLAGGAGGVYLSTDGGEHWTAVSTGLTTSVSSLTISEDGTTVYAGTGGYGVWRRPLSELMQVTAVSTDPSPRNTMSIRAYPNPFNPSTTIRFSLRDRAPVRLVVLDISGRQVRTLVNEIRGAGEQRVTWDGRDDRGSAMGSGVYIYRLEAHGESRTGKLSLMK